MPAHRKPLAPGDRFGLWTVLYEAQKQGGHSAYWCQCRCGKVKRIRQDSLICGDTTQCHSCSNRVGRNLRHGENRREAMTPEYAAWARMFQRCSLNYARTSDYVTRGIAVCEQWSGEGGFEAFLEDVGRRPSPKYTLDRIDNDRGYEPGNVRWATSREQARNRRSNRFLTIDGVTKCVAEWAEKSPVTATRIKARLDSGWDAHKAVFSPARRAA